MEMRRPAPHPCPPALPLPCIAPCHSNTVYGEWAPMATPGQGVHNVDYVREMMLKMEDVAQEVRMARETPPPAPPRHCGEGCPKGGVGLPGHATSKTVEDRGRIILQSAPGAIPRAVKATTFFARDMRRPTTLWAPWRAPRRDRTGGPERTRRRRWPRVFLCHVAPSTDRSDHWAELLTPHPKRWRGRVPIPGAV